MFPEPQNVALLLQFRDATGQHQVEEHDQVGSVLPQHIEGFTAQILCKDTPSVWSCQSKHTSTNTHLKLGKGGTIQPSHSSCKGRGKHKRRLLSLVAHLLLEVPQKVPKVNVEELAILSTTTP